MVINWGPELIQIYNDAAMPVFGRRHPAAMGHSARTNLPEFWEYTSVEAIQEHIYASGLPFRAEDERLYVRRKGFVEESYFTFSLSPILDDDGTVLGILNTYVETTSRMLNERRMATLRGLGARAVRARSPGEACAEAVAALAVNPFDLRFVLIYLADRDGASATLAGASGIATETTAGPSTLAAELPAGGAFAWPLAEVLRERKSVHVKDLASKVDLGPPVGRVTPPNEALVLPLVPAAEGAPAGILVVGLSPRLSLDDAYCDFLKLVASQVGAGIGSAQAYYEASERAEKLAEIDRAKSVFYSNISHEFRTPLTLMLGPVEDMLREEDDGRLTQMQREKLVTVRRNALRLLRLVSGLLDLSRVEGGKLKLRSEPTDLAKLTREVASAFESGMALAGLHFVVDCPPMPCAVSVDRGVWETIVLNLLSNALKYTPRGEVSLALRADEDRARLVVRDTGVGIPDTALPHVFERFYRARESEARSIEGSGIGLALVRELARALHGEVIVASTLGEGSTFTIEIPLEAVPLEQATKDLEPPEPEAGGRSAFVQEAEGWVEPHDIALPPSPIEGLPARPRILVVEDNPDMRRYLAHVLSREYDIKTVPDGAAALEAVAVRLPDLVLSDVLMPGLDGLALVRALRANGSTRSVPAILLTARAGEDAALEGLGSGADDYVVKPFSSRELRARIRTHLQLAQARREAAQSAMKDAFLGVASHELRTPLMNLKLQLELLGRETGASVHAAASRLDAVRRSVARIEDLADELLTVSAVRTGTLVLSRAREDLAALCRASATEQGHIAQRSVSLDLPPEPMFATVDARRLRQVLDNLLSNALKYSPPDRPVVLQLRRANGDAVVAVHDEGPGIPDDALPHLFEGLYRVPGVEVFAGSRTGLGLGLFVSQAIVSHHGGRIDVRSRPGEGSTFSVHLPLSERSGKPS
jgi:signal transduction histidine kinase